MPSELWDNPDPPAERPSREERERWQEDKLDAEEDKEWERRQKSLDFLIGQWKRERRKNK